VICAAENFGFFCHMKSTFGLVVLLEILEIQVMKGVNKKKRPHR